MAAASQLRVLSILSNAVGLAALAFLLLVDLPQATGMVIVCGDDAQRPGSLVCISPTPLGLILRAGIATSGLVLGNKCKHLFYAANKRNGIRF